LVYAAVVSVPLEIEHHPSINPGPREADNKENIDKANVIGGSQNVVHISNDTNPESNLSQQTN